MSLCLAWERTTEKRLKFLAVQVVVYPETRFGLDKRQQILKNHQILGATGLADRTYMFEERLRGALPLRRPALYLRQERKSFILGTEALLQGDTAGAAVYFRLATARDDILADAYFALALCSDNAAEQLCAIDCVMVRKEHYTRVFRHYRIGLSALLPICNGKRLRLMNDDPGLHLLASEIYQKHGKLEEAKRLLENSPFADLDLFRFTRGELLMELRQYEQSIDLLKRVTGNSQLAGPAFYLLGVALQKLGYGAAAIQVFRNCLEKEDIGLELEKALRTQLSQALEGEGHHYRAARELDRLAALETKGGQPPTKPAQYREDRS